MRAINHVITKLVLTTAITLTGFITNQQVVSANDVETSSQNIVEEVQAESVSSAEVVNSDSQDPIEGGQTNSLEQPTNSAESISSPTQATPIIAVPEEVVSDTNTVEPATNAEEVEQIDSLEANQFSNNVSMRTFSVTAEDSYTGNNQSELVNYEQKFNRDKLTSSEGVQYHSIEGSNRYANAAEISQNTFQNSDTVYMVNGEKEADALTGVVLAANEGAPILLTYDNKLSEYTEAELKRLGTQNVVLLGGEHSIKQNVVQSLEKFDINVERLGGKNRYAQAALVADRIIKNNGGSVEEAFITNGYASADALSISSIAADRQAPVFLTGTDDLNEAVKPYVKNIKKWTVIGGTSSISDSVLNELRNLGAVVERISGANRYEVNRNIIDRYHTDKDHFFIASGEVFSDALPVSVTASINNSGVLLVKNNYGTITAQLPVLGDGDKLTFVGGPNTVTPQTRLAFTNENKYFESITKAELSKTRNVPSGKEYISINNNVPYFSNDDITSTDDYYKIGNLDHLDRVTQANALLSEELMPTEQRGNTPDYKPTGWNQKRYTNVPGGWLFHRSHLIGHQLVGDDSIQNLMTGTQWFNQDAMLPFENNVANYIESTGNHVRYRVTPVFQGSNKLASGLYMEAFSIEDNGEGIMFNIYVPNRQAGIAINYSNGLSSGPEGPQEYDPEESVELSKVHKTIRGKAPDQGEAIKAGKVDTNNNGIITIDEAKAAGFKMPVKRNNWLYKYMNDNDNDGQVGESA